MYFLVIIFYLITNLNEKKIPNWNEETFVCAYRTTGIYTYIGLCVGWARTWRWRAVSYTHLDVYKRQILQVVKNIPWNKMATPPSVSARIAVYVILHILWYVDHKFRTNLMYSPTIILNFLDIFYVPYQFLRYDAKTFCSSFS